MSFEAGGGCCAGIDKEFIYSRTCPLSPVLFREAGAISGSRNCETPQLSKTEASIPKTEMTMAPTEEGGLRPTGVPRS